MGKKQGTAAARPRGDSGHSDRSVCEEVKLKPRVQLDDHDGKRGMYSSPGHRSIAASSADPHDGEYPKHSNPRDFDCKIDAGHHKTSEMAFTGPATDAIKGVIREDAMEIQPMETSALVNEANTHEMIKYESVHTPVYRLLGDIEGLIEPARRQIIDFAEGAKSPTAPDEDVFAAMMRKISEDDTYRSMYMDLIEGDMQPVNKQTLDRLDILKLEHGITCPYTLRLTAHFKEMTRLITRWRKKEDYNIMHPGVHTRYPHELHDWIGEQQAATLQAHKKAFNQEKRRQEAYRSDRCVTCCAFM